MQHTLAFVIAESSQIGAARRSTLTLAELLGFDEVKQGELALVVTEIASNLLAHAGHGELIVRAMASEETTGIELVAVDKGCGMVSVSQSLRDGYSTAGTAGHGLGAIARLSQQLEIYSLANHGTVLLAQVWAKSEVPPSVPASIKYGVVSRPKPGQEVCGDSWAVEHLPERSLFFLADGLGHGQDAGIASQEAVRAFRQQKHKSPKAILEAVHAAISGTRGAAAAVAEIHWEKHEVCFAGIGNIAGTVVFPAKTQSLISHNGIVGHQVRKIQEFVSPWDAEAILVLHSDGLSSRWQLERYAGLTVRHPGLIAGVLYRDFQRDTDDATVLTASVFPRRTTS